MPANVRAATVVSVVGNSGSKSGIRRPAIAKRQIARLAPICALTITSECDPHTTVIREKGWSAHGSMYDLVGHGHPSMLVGDRAVHGCIHSYKFAGAAPSPGTSRTIQAELAAGQSHDYQLHLRAGEYARVVVEQQTVDVAVACFGPEGQQLFVVDRQVTGDAETVEMTGETRRSLSSADHSVRAARTNRYIRDFLSRVGSRYRTA